MVRLDDLIGQRVLMSLVNSEVAAYDVILHGVENGGIWIESKELETLLGHRKGKPMRMKPSKKPVFFYPYHQIALLISYSTDL